MSKILKTLSLLLLLTLGLVKLSWATGNDGIILQLRSDIDYAHHDGYCSLDQLHRECGATSVTAISMGKNLYQVRFANADVAEQMIYKYQAHPDVQYAEINYALASEKPMDLKTFNLSVQSLSAASLSKASNRAIVAIVDSGVDYTHTDLKNFMWVNSGEDLDHDGVIEDSEKNSKDDDGDGIIDDFYGANLCSLTGTSGDPKDVYGHGTHVAGIVLQNGINAAGQNGVEIMAVKFLNDSGVGYLVDGAKAIDYALDHGAKVVNCSWGYNYNSNTLSNVMAKAEQMGVAIVCAAGNYNSDSPLYPAYYNYSVSVAALDQHGYKASFSNYGNYVDLAAEGVSVYSTYPHNQYATLSGTSMAAPKVSGLLAAAWSSQPNLSLQQILQDIPNAATDITDPLHTGANGYTGKDPYTGYGSLSLNSLLSTLGATTPIVSVASLSSTHLSNLMNYPNPVGAGANTTFGFSSDSNVDVTVKVFTLRGQLVRQFTTSKSPVGSYVKVVYDCTDDGGSRLPMDVYLYQVQAQDSVGTVASGIGKLVVVN